jgi:hypothetical protein
MCGRPPCCKDFVQLGRVWSIAVMCPALCLRSDRPLAQMGCADRVPNIFAMSEHHWVPRGVPILGSTDRHLAGFLASARVGRAVSGSGLLRPAIDLAAHHHGPERPGHLVGQRHGRELLRPPRQQIDQPGRLPARRGEADHGGCAEHQELAQTLIALPADPALPVSPAGRVLFWGSDRARRQSGGPSGSPWGRSP